MKKEKTVKSYKRRTKSGKMVTVRQHTAKYDAAEKAKEAAKKKGAGEEFEERKKSKQLEIPFEEEKKSEKDLLAEVKEEQKKLKEPKSKKTTPKTEKSTKVTKEKTEKKSTKKETASEPAFTVAEFKEWYQGTGSAADKKVAKALRAQLGRAGYKKLEDEAIDNYSARGHLSMFKRVSSDSNTKETAKPKEVKKASSKAEGTKIDSGHDEATKSQYKNQKEYLDKMKKQGNLPGGKFYETALASYWKEHKKILSDLEKKGAQVKSREDLAKAESSFIKKHKLQYEEDGIYGDNSGKSYRLTTHPITGETKMHPLKGYTTAATDAQFREAGFKVTGKDKKGKPIYDYDDSAAWKRLSNIIWGGAKAQGKSTKDVAATPKSETTKSKKAESSGEDFQVKESALKRLDREIKRLENPRKLWGPYSRVQEIRKGQKEDLRRYRKAKEYLENGDRLKAAKLLVNIDSDYGNFKSSEFYSKAEIKSHKDKYAKKQAKEKAYRDMMNDNSPEGLRKRADAMEAQTAKAATKKSREKLVSQGYKKYISGGETFYFKGKEGSYGGSYKQIDAKGNIVNAISWRKEHFKAKIAKTVGKTYKPRNLK